MRHDLGKDMFFPDPAGNQLAVLRPEIKDQNSLLVRIIGFFNHSSVIHRVIFLLLVVYIYIDITQISLKE